MSASRPQIGDFGALIKGRHLETYPRAGGVFLEDQADFLATQLWHFGTSIFGCFQVGCQFQQETDFARAEIPQREKVSAFQIEGHCMLLECQMASRMVGQLMQRPPPRPRPSSAPGTFRTSIPAASRAALVSSLRS